MGRACSTNGEKRNACRILVGKSEGKKPLGRPRRRWVDNIKMGPPCGGGVEYLQRNPASRRRQRKGKSRI
jgi:hypothetical protein